MIFVIGALVGVGIGLWSIGGLLKYRREQHAHLSDVWRTAQQRQDLIHDGQWDGYVRWPWNSSDDFDDAA